MMRIFAVSDLHGNLPYVSECEMLLLGGDYSPERDPDKERRFLEGPFREWLERVPAKYIVGIAGNHDLILQKDPNLANTLPWMYLQDRLIEIEGVRIYGTPWTPTFYNWAFQGTEQELAEKFSIIPKDLDILLTHGPAYKRLDEATGGYHVGSTSLARKIEEVRPSNVVCGHIHEGRGIMQVDNTRYYNVTYVNSRMAPVYAPMTVALRV